MYPQEVVIMSTAPILCDCRHSEPLKRLLGISYKLPGSFSFCKEIFDRLYEFNCESMRRYQCTAKQSATLRLKIFCACVTQNVMDKVMR